MYKKKVRLYNFEYYDYCQALGFLTKINSSPAFNSIT